MKLVSRTVRVLQAGGLDALEKLLDELLQRRTSMEVSIVEDGMTMYADVVYVMPPNAEMIVNDGKLYLSSRDRGPVQTLPLNMFFSS